MKVLISTVGEYDFVNTVYSRDSYDTEVFYESLLFIVYILFMCLLVIVVPNLMVRSLVKTLLCYLIGGVIGLNKINFC